MKVSEIKILILIPILMLILISSSFANCLDLFSSIEASEEKIMSTYKEEIEFEDDLFPRNLILSAAQDNFKQTFSPSKLRDMIEDLEINKFSRDDYFSLNELLREAYKNALDSFVDLENPDGLVTVDIKIKGSELIFRIKDNGQGIQDDIFEQLFEERIGQGKAKTQALGDQELGVITILQNAQELGFLMIQIETKHESSPSRKKTIKNTGEIKKEDGNLNETGTVFELSFII
ncbi:MAG: ATP-binding protein [Pseudomonadota bacterium]